MVKRTRMRRTGQGANKKNRLKRVEREYPEKVKKLFVETVDYKPRNYDFSKGYAEKWDVALELTEEEMENQYFLPMMNYYYPLPQDFERDMQNKFGDDWRKKIKNEMNNTTVVYFTDEEEYAIALTGGGMNLSWEICETYMNLGYLPPLHFCDLPRMAGKQIKGKNKMVVLACLRSVEASKSRAGWAGEKLEDILKSETL